MQAVITPGSWRGVTQLSNSAKNEACFIRACLGNVGAVARNGWLVFQTEPLSASPPAEQTGHSLFFGSEDVLWQCLL